MASEETFRSWPALQAAIAKDVQQRIETCQVEEPQLLSGPQIKPRKAAQHPGTQIAWSQIAFQRRLIYKWLESVCIVIIIIIITIIIIIYIPLWFQLSQHLCTNSCTGCLGSYFILHVSIPPLSACAI